jgi:hypothetical protein
MKAAGAAGPKYWMAGRVGVSALLLIFVPFFLFL